MRRCRPVPVPCPAARCASAVERRLSAQVPTGGGAGGGGRGYRDERAAKARARADGTAVGPSAGGDGGLAVRVVLEGLDRGGRDHVDQRRLSQHSGERGERSTEQR